MIDFKSIPLFNVIFNISASLIMRLGSLFVTTIMVKGIGQSEFGHYMYVITTALMLSTISTMATGQAYIKEVSKGPQYQQSFIQYLSNLLTIFVIFCSLFIGYIYWGSSNSYLIDNYGVIIVVAFLELLNLAFISLFSGTESFKRIFNGKLIFSITLCTLVFFATYLGSYLSVYPYIIAITVTNIYLFKQSKIDFKPLVLRLFNQNSLVDFYHKYIRLSFPIFLSGLMVTPVQWYLSNQIALQNGFAELGLFNISMQFRMMILMVTNSVAAVLLPRLVKANDTADFTVIKKTGYYFSAVFCIIMLIGLVIIMPFVFQFYEIQTNSRLLSASYLLMVTALPLCLYNIHTQVLIATGKTRILLLFNSFWGLIVISLYWSTDTINNFSAAKILCISYFALIIFVFVFNRFFIKNNELK